MERCYFCGERAQGREHAPPRLMFKAFDCDSITVPSCDLHNSKKSGADQAIVHGFFKSLIPYKNTLNGDVLKAFKFEEPSFPYTKRTAVVSKMIKNIPEEYRDLPNLAYLTPKVKMKDWICQLTAAIIYSGTQINDPTIPWGKIRIESPEWKPAIAPESVEVREAQTHFSRMEEMRSRMAKLVWKEGWSASPRAYPENIYRFFLHFSQDEVIMHHIFYERYNWYAWISASRQLITSLKGKIDMEKRDKDFKGPYVYENWKEFLSGIQIKYTHEYPFLSDARITGENTTDFKPYYFFNPVPKEDKPGLVQPTIYVRVEIYLEIETPDMSRTDSERYHGGGLTDEIAALSSLALGIRLKAGSVTRVFDLNGDPKGRPVEWFAQPKPVVLVENRGIKIPSVIREAAIEKLAPLSGLPDLSPSDAIALIRVARLYQDALWIAESEPSLAWLMLVSAAETAANHWHKSDDTPLERLKVSKPELVDLLESKCSKDLPAEVAGLIVDSIGNTKKFRDFIINFLPPPPTERPPDWTQISWKESEMKKAMNLIYGYRSKALHEGRPFPAPMCMSPYFKSPNGIIIQEKPHGTAFSMFGGTWKERDVPMLLNTFEYIVRCTLLKWWESLATSE